MATNSIAEPFSARRPRPINILARQAANRLVREGLRAQGKHLTRMRAADIAAMAQQYLADHPELYLVAACKIDQGDKGALRLALAVASDRDKDEPTCRGKPLPDETPMPEGWGEKPKDTPTWLEWLKRLLRYLS